MDDKKLLLNNLLALAGLIALSVLAFTGKAPVEALVTYLVGLGLRPGVSPAASP